MAQYTNQYRGNAPEYKASDKVWLSTKSIKINRPLYKLAEWQLGPFEIIKVISLNVVKLKLSASFKIHDIINILWVQLYKAPVAGQQVIPPEPIEVEGSPEYEVEEVLDSWLKRGKLEYLVKWSGYTNDHNTWESKSNLVNSKEVINDFHKLNPSACASYIQMFLKNWYLNCLKIYATLSTFFLTWKSKPKKGIVLWVDFHLINFWFYLIGLPYLISEHSNVWTCIHYHKVQEWAHGKHMPDTCSTVQCYMHSLFYCITHSFSFYLPIMHSTY